MPNCPGKRSSAENSEENPMQRRDIAFGNEQRGPGYAVCEIQYTVDASDRETDEVLAVENFKEAQHRKKPSNFNEKVHQIFIVQRAVEERTWENVVDEPVRDFIRTDYETEKPHGERDKADEEENRKAIIFVLFFCFGSFFIFDGWSYRNLGGFWIRTLAKNGLYKKNDEIPRENAPRRIYEDKKRDSFYRFADSFSRA
jgi:hypothetical protein